MELGLAGWSLNRRFRAGELKLLDYPKLVKDEFGLSVIELNSPFFERQLFGRVTGGIVAGEHFWLLHPA